MRTIYIIVVLILFSACKKEEEKSYYNLDTNVTFYVANAAGDDLLDPNNPDSYKANEIHVYNIINNEEVEVFTFNEMTSSFVLKKNEITGRYFFSTGFYYKSKDIFLIKWNDNITDTIRGQYREGDHFITYDKVWYNGELIYDNTIPGSHPANRDFTIIR